MTRPYPTLTLSYPDPRRRSARARLSVLLLMTRNVRLGAAPRPAGNGPLKLLNDSRTLTRLLLAAPGQPLTHSGGRLLSLLPFTSSVSSVPAVASADGTAPARRQRGRAHHALATRSPPQGKAKP